MKLRKALSVIASVGALFAFVASANAQNSDPIVEDFRFFSKRILGQTCVESEDKSTKCTTLDAAGFAPVANIGFRTRGARDLMVQFCAKVEDKSLQGLECQALVNTAATSPGSITPNDNLTETIYNFCTTWFGTASGRWRGITRVEVECENKQKVNMTDPVEIVDYVMSVFTK